MIAIGLMQSYFIQSYIGLNSELPSFYFFQWPELGTVAIYSLLLGLFVKPNATTFITDGSDWNHSSIQWTTGVRMWTQSFGFRGRTKISKELRTAVVKINRSGRPTKCNWRFFGDQLATYYGHILQVVETTKDRQNRKYAIEDSLKCWNLH